jgi:hypothetical protein
MLEDRNFGKVILELRDRSPGRNGSALDPVSGEHPMRTIKVKDGRAGGRALLPTHEAIPVTV